MCIRDRFMRDTETERGRDIGRGRSRLHAGSLMQDLIPRFGDHALSWRQMLNCSATQAPLTEIFNMKIVVDISQFVCIWGLDYVGLCCHLIVSCDMPRWSSILRMVQHTLVKGKVFGPRTLDSNVQEALGFKNKSKSSAAQLLVAARIISTLFLFSPQMRTLPKREGYSSSIYVLYTHTYTLYTCI